MFVTEALCYLQERIVSLRVALLWLLLWGCALSTAVEPLARLPWLAIVSALFIVAFRLWDDLADLEHDRRHSPGRCLVRATNLRPFHTAQWLLITLLAVLLVTVGSAHALAFVCLVAVMFAMYRLTSGRAELRPFRQVAVLSKYPVFVLLVAHSPGDSGALLAALIAYLPPLIDEFRSSGAALLLPAVILTGFVLLAWLALTT